jgi:hypothetical protein
VSAPEDDLASIEKEVETEFEEAGAFIQDGDFSAAEDAAIHLYQNETYDDVDQPRYRLPPKPCDNVYQLRHR